MNWSWKKTWIVVLSAWLFLFVGLYTTKVWAQEDHDYTKKFFDSIIVKEPTVEAYPILVHLHLSRDTVQTIFRFDDGIARCYYILPAYDNRSPVLSCVSKK